VRRGLGAVTTIALLLLLGGMLFRLSSPRYAPDHHLREWAFVAAAVYLFATYWWVRTADASRMHRVRYLQATSLVGTALVIAVYAHFHAGDKRPSGLWRGDYFVDITPFHEQLAIPLLLGLLLPMWIVSVALQIDRSDQRQQVA
jgi:hypothetical protein